MMLMLIMLVVVGARVSASTPGKPEERDVYEPLQCGPNSHFERCSKICPPQNCSALIDPYWLCENSRCKPECRCNDGYVRDDRTGLCISRDECLAQCAPLERFVKDSLDCQRTCANCKVTGPGSLCKPFTGCVCEEGRVRVNDNATGACVLPKDCPIRQCPLHEHWEKCPSVCAKETCISKNPDYTCLMPVIPPPCKPRCICDKGYLRNHLGQCIPENHCPIKRCPINEVWRCATMCAQDSCKRLEPGFKCPPGIISICIPVCACKDGYLRNDRGLCIPRELCPASLRCGINEVAVECQSVIPQTCESVYTLYRPIENPPCIPGCDCRPGYLRNKQNICVPSEFCPTVPQNKCGPNQEYKECGSGCEPSCSDLDNPPQMCPAVCIEGCFCKEGYLKDEHGNCVPRSQCPLPVCNKPNEVAKDCGSYCEMKTCEDYNRTDIVCPAVCVRGCFCRKGYVRNAYGICIRPEKCPPKPVCLQEHEEYQSCGSSCPDNCDNYVNPNRICTMNCVAGCNCKKGYVRNLQDNTCIKPEQCPSKECTGENEKLNLCASYCPVTCANRYTQGDWSCITLCREACDCIPGTLRNDSGACVPVEQCTPPVCRENEKYMKCGTACPLTCDNYKKPPPCTRQCVEDCFCKDGYVRDRFMRCVKPEDCEPICPAGEKFNECSAHCQDTCENYNVTNRICTYQCQSGCVCEEGTVRRKDGQCVRPSECTDLQCPKNEVYDPCPPINCPPGKSCAQVCRPTCRCADGLVRCKDGRCAKSEDCGTSHLQCPENEVYDCIPTKCLPGISCTNMCIPTCRCVDGLVRCKDGRCAKSKDRGTTDSQCPKNEVYDPCPPINCPPGKSCAQVCRPTCRCADGLVRCKDGRCAKSENCGTTPECPPSEYFDKCNAHCEDTCELHGSNVTCLPYCNAGCRCNDGLVRRKDGQCVPLQDCSAPLCSSGEVYDPCPPINCPPGYSCAQVCRPGCKCADGLIRCKDGRCAKREDCETKPQCPVNERWVDCVIGLCIPLRCDQLGFPIGCPGIVGPCKGGCVCAENYVRDSNDICIPKKDCPSCGNDYNATSGCGIHCGRQCNDYKERPNCIIPIPCQYNGCDCKQGYVHDIVTERCIAPVDCPIPCNGDLYAEKIKCPNPCPATCAKPTTAVCPRACLREGCQCRPGFVLNPDGKCIRPENCPDDLGCNGDPNARISSCVSLCEPICGFDPRFCPASCQLGCACKSGFILSKPNGICIKPEQCVNDTTSTTQSPCEKPTSRTTRDAPSQLILCPRDEIWIDCKAGYRKPQYCRDINVTLPSPQVDDSCPGGCICRDGLLRNEDGVCIPKDECPTSKPCSDPNAIRKKCASHESCRATCAVPNSRVCPKICIIDGCECKQGYVLSAKGGKCVKIEDCPHNVSCNGDQNATIKAFPQACPSTCQLPNGKPGCRKLGPDVGCVCKPGYLKADDNGKCILPDDCKGGNPCGANATLTSCRSYCAYEYCPADDRPNITPCEQSYPCPSGCVCKLNYKRKSKEDDTCILSSTCPPVKCTRPNEIWDPCPSECRRESCLDVNNQPTTCNTLVLNCQPQCTCKKGYFRNNKNICIPAKDCPNSKPCDDPNAVRLECAPSPSCRSTCAIPNPSPCILSCAVNECVCKKGYVLSAKGGKCIPVDQCPKDAPCNGDSNAVIKANPIPCPSTCSAPNASPWCKRYAPPVGCECKPGYLQVEDGGKCIKPEQCPGGNPCGINSTFVWCKAGCPTDYCPVDDSRAIIACDPPYPCPNGCVCKLNYRRKSVSDETCILASTCPPVKCTRPNEIWDPCPSDCRREYCADINDQPTTCNTLVLNCQPQCVCKKGYFRNDTDICIPGKDCPNNKPCDDPNAERLECAPVPSCRSTCARPNPSPCIDSCSVNECVCKKGYVLSAKGGKCIPVNECPKDAPCNGDINAVIEANPIPCPSTCSGPNASPYCRRYAPPVGCVCRSGYLLADDGKCIKPDKCPGGNPCGKNATFVDCVYYCSDNYCPEGDSSGTAVACSPPRGKCPSGCACKKNYKRKSRSDYTCVLSSDCPNNQPCDDPNAERLECAPALSCRSTCATPNPSPCISSCAVNECVCKKGYVLSTKGGKCVPVNECPKDVPCNGDSNAVIKANPIPCPSTCSTPNASPWCKRYAPPVGCECKPGFLQVEDGGKCIKPEKCPGGNPCGVNSTFVWCKVGCPTDYCPVDDRRAIVACSPPYPCPSGCVCKVNYRKKSLSDDRCILASTCPPVKCTRPNEIWDPCPSACRRERCEDVNNQPTTCNTLLVNCQPQCVCKKGYFRNDTDICIPEKDCPKSKICSDPNAERVKCAPAIQCRPTCAVRDPGPCIEICVVDDCVCKKGHILSDKGGKCIPENQCPPNNQCSDPNAERVECALAEGCRPTCAVPNPGPCLSQICIKNECVCKKGYVLSEKRGKCVVADQCPIQKSCNGDPNARIKECPLACPATCSIPNTKPCPKACEPIGCECKDGYILSESNGQCIHPEKCKGGNPCGRNETFVSCKVPCPSDYCPVGNSPNTVNCETPNPCYPGCVCKFNYRRKSVDDRRCIYASECPPQKCNKNEVWSGCPSECLQEDCSDVNKKPVICNTLLLNCQPKCICKKGHYRDSKRNCVPASQCPKPIKCKANEVYRTCRIICPPQTCASTYTSYDCRDANTRCEPGCDCIPEYLRNGTENDRCIPSSQCPTTAPPRECGINEHYETNRNKCDLTCKNYENESIMGPCPATSGCFCDEGYVRNSNGLCIPKIKCPQNIVCPPNEVLSKCYNSCHKTCKTRLRSDGRMCHLACIDSGCLCKEGYLRHDNGTCVPISECSPPRCNQNETYSSCGTACPPTCQNRGDNCTACTDQCVEDCFCKKGLVRDDDGNCIKPKECPKRTCSGPNEVFDECPPTCPPTDGCSNIWSKFNCTNPVQCCKPQCRCAPVFFRNKNGICVPANQC